VFEGKHASLFSFHHHSHKETDSKQSRTVRHIFVHLLFHSPSTVGAVHCKLVAISKLRH